MKIEVYIHATWDEWRKEYRFYPWGQDMSSQTGCGPLVETLVVDFTPPPHEVLVKGTIEQYRNEQQKIRAEAESRINHLQQHINDLLSLEYKPGDGGVIPAAFGRTP